MNTSQVRAVESECTIFTVNVEDRIYHCPVSAEALYMLCRGQDDSLSQLDAYFLLKLKVQKLVEKLIAAGMNEMPAPVTPRHLIDFCRW